MNAKTNTYANANTNAKRSLGERIYSNAKNVMGDQAGRLGRFSAYLSFGGATVLGIVLIIVAIVLIRRNPKQTEETTATIVLAECENKGTTTPKGTTQNNIQCMLKYSFKATDGNAYQPTQFTQGNWYQTNQEIPIRYDPKNPYDSSLRSWLTAARVGWILIGIAIFIMIIAGVHLFMVLTFPIAASAQGMGTAAGVMRNAWS